MNFTYFKVKAISSAVASTIAFTLTLTAFAQDSPRLRTPRRVFQGRIDIRNANIADAGHTSESQYCARPRTGTERPWTRV